MADTINYAGMFVLLVLGLWGTFVFLYHKDLRDDMLFSFFAVALFLSLLVNLNRVHVNHLDRLLAYGLAVGIYALARKHPRVTANVLNVLAWMLVVAVVVESGRNALARSGLGNVNMTASLLLLLLPWGGGWVGLLALLATRSRGAIIGAGVAYLLKWRGMARWVLPVGIVAMVVALGAALAIRPNTVTVRITESRDAVQWFVQRPLFGWGAGSTPTLYADDGRIHFDCAPLTILVEMGVVGLAAWVFTIYQVAKATLSTDSAQPSPARWGLVAWLVHQSFDDTLWWPWVLMVLMANIALAMEGYQPVEHRFKLEPVFEVSKS